MNTKATAAVVTPFIDTVSDLLAHNRIPTLDAGQMSDFSRYLFTASNKTERIQVTKRDLVFIVERLLPQLEERRIEVLARNRGIKKAQASDSIGKLMGAYIHKAEEGELGRLLVETVILHTARTQSETGKALKDAAQHYKVDTDAITQKVKTEFAAKEKAQAVKKTAAKVQPKPAKPAAVKKAKAA